MKALFSKRTTSLKITPVSGIPHPSEKGSARSAAAALYHLSELYRLKKSKNLNNAGHA